MIDNIYDHPDLYDALFPPGAHVPFYVDLARQHAGAVLELACGTGQITVPLAALSHPVVGLDQSGPMLNVARTRASTAGALVEFVEGDMRDFTLGRAFTLIFVPRNSLLHLLSTADLLAAFAAVRRHLTPDGVFAFDIFNPDVRLLARARGQRASLMEVTTAAFGELRVDETPDYDPAAQVNHATLHISTTDRPDAWVVPLHVRNIFPQELPLLVSAAGFELISRCGDFSGTPFGTGSRSQVCLCRAR